MKRTGFLYIFAVVALFMIAAPAFAQTNGAQPASVSSSDEGKKPAKQSNSGEQNQTGDAEQLKSKVEQLQSLVEQQQRLLVEMQKRLDEIEAKTQRSIARPTQASTERSDDAQPAARTAMLEIDKTASAATDAAQTPARPQDRPVAGWDREHAFIRSADGSFETKFTGYGQLDFRGYETGTNPTNTFLLRRARLALEGKLHRFYEYKIEGDFADTANTLLRDLYVNIHRIDEFQLRFGQFRVPISQEEIRSDNVQDFVERSMVNNLAPSRSPGLQAWGTINKGVFEYYVGAFNGKGLLAANNNGTPESAVRLRFNPWKHSDMFWAKGFIFGGAFTQGRSFGGPSVRGRTESQSVTFYSPDTTNGKYIRANAEMTWLLGPAAIRAEYVQTNQSRDNLGVSGRDLPGVVGKGLMAQFTYMLTGENKPEAGIIAPKRSLFGDESGKTGLGAWELKFRYANLQIANGTSKTNRAESFYFGPNWYLNRFVRYLLDFGVERFNDPLRAPRVGDRNFFVVLSRIQFAF